MHQFSLVQGLHNQLLALAHEHRVEKILKAEVLIGDNAGIVAESFVFGTAKFEDEVEKETGAVKLVREAIKVLSGPKSSAIKTFIDIEVGFSHGRAMDMKSRRWNN